jgi:hypothetical protein
LLQLLLRAPGRIAGQSTLPFRLTRGDFRLLHRGLGIGNADARLLGGIGGFSGGS